MLDASKRYIYLNKLNFLGFETAPNRRRVSLREIRYMGEYENTAITNNNFGVLPSFAKYFEHSKKKANTPEKPEEEKDEHDKLEGEFRKFYKFMA